MALLPKFLRVSLTRFWRRARWHCIRCIFIVAGVPTFAGTALAAQPRLEPFEKPRPRELIVPIGGQTFDPNEALNGAYSSPDQCERVPGGLWVEVDGMGDCIRFYAHGLSTLDHARCLVFFSGDVMLWTSKGVRHITSAYRKQSPSSIEEAMTQWSREAGVPAIYLARPGIYGSSGDHNMRRRHREIALMSGALDVLREQYGISSFILTGQSGGGQIVAGLLNWRTDIEAAIISSGLVSPRRVANFWEHRREVPGHLLYDAKAFYDPVDELGRIPQNPSPEIYVISDPEDRTVPFSSQLYYVRRLRALGLNPHHIYAYGTDSRRHRLERHGKLVAAMVAQGRTPAEVRNALHEIDMERF